METSLCQYTLARKGNSMLHPPPAQPALSDIFTVKVMILDTRNVGDPAWSVDSGISLMNWTRKPCWHKEEGFRLGVTSRHKLAVPARKTGWVGAGQVGWLRSWAGCYCCSSSSRGHRLPAHSGVAIVGQEPLLVMYSETKLP